MEVAVWAIPLFPFSYTTTQAEMKNLPGVNNFVTNAGEGDRAVW